MKIISEKCLDKTLPINMPFTYKLAIKALVIHNAPFEDVCLGCGIHTKEDLAILGIFLAKYNYKIPVLLKE